MLSVSGSHSDTPPQTSTKVLLMGRAGAGKTSMRSIIFANYLARESRRLTATNNIEHSHLRFLGNLVLSLWDCGGQDVFMENYFESQRDHIFRTAEVLIYVLEVHSLTNVANIQRQTRQKEVDKDFHYLKNTLESIKAFSPNARIFILVHKMDLISEADRESVLNSYRQDLQRLYPDIKLRIFATSIWDETLFRAWSAIVCCLIPNAQLLDEQLKQFCQICHADEVVLFEKSTFLVISHCALKKLNDDHRYEKVSNICKQFKLTCGKTQANFSSITIHNSSLSAFIEKFTQNTYIMLVVTDARMEPAASLCNIDYAREHFERMADRMKFGPTL